MKYAFKSFSSLSLDNACLFATEQDYGKNKHLSSLEFIWLGVTFKLDIISFLFFKTEIIETLSGNVNKRFDANKVFQD